RQRSPSTLTAADSPRLGTHIPVSVAVRRRGRRRIPAPDDAAGDGHSLRAGLHPIRANDALAPAELFQPGAGSRSAHTKPARTIRSLRVSNGRAGRPARRPAPYELSR